MQTIQLQDGIAEWKGKVSYFFFLLIDIVYAEKCTRGNHKRHERTNECMNEQCNFCEREKRKPQLEYKIPSMEYDV